MKPKDITLDWESCERITRDTLINYRDMIRSETFEVLKGRYIHPDDAREYERVLAAIDIVLGHITP
jgi:hypothetical protein